MLIETPDGNVLREGLKTQERRRFPCNAQLREFLQSIKPENAKSEDLIFPGASRRSMARPKSSASSFAGNGSNARSRSRLRLSMAIASHRCLNLGDNLWINDITRNKEGWTCKTRYYLKCLIA